MRLFSEGRRIVPVLVLLAVMLPAFPASGDDSQPPPKFLAEAKANFKDWDQNGDGTLSFQETTRLVPSPSFHDTSAAALAAVHLVQRRPSWSRAAFPRNVLFAATPAESDPRPPFELYYRTGLAHIRATERTLFTDVAPNLRTIRQGPLGDCYFLATLGALVHRNPKDVRRLVRREDDGSFYVKFPDGEPVHVHQVSDTEIALASLAGGQGLWLNVLEKAYGALVERSLARRGIAEAAIDAVGDGGLPIAAMTLFTGCDAGLVRFRPEGPRAVPSALRVKAFLPLMRSLLLTNTRGGLLTTCATADAAVPPGMAKTHLYAVLDFDPARNVVHLWNPWGNYFEPKDAPGLSSGYQVRQGQFVVPLADFIRIFDRVIYETDQPANIG
jgi:hypothetical protein